MGHPGRGPNDFLCVQDECQLRTFSRLCDHPDQQGSQRSNKVDFEVVKSCHCFDGQRLLRVDQEQIQLLWLWKQCENEA